MLSAKTFISTLFITSMISTTAYAVRVPKDFYGINAWMPHEIGANQFYGILDQLWDDVGDSSANLVRMGGIAADQSFYTDTQLVETLINIKNINSQPVVQVPLNGGEFTAENAARIVQLVNEQTSHMNVKYWSIGNEPNLYENYTVAEYAQHVKDFSIAMKEIDPEIKIIAGELAWYDQTWINSLLGGDASITGINPDTDLPYVDYFSFHTYPFGDVEQTRESALSSLTAFSNNLSDLRNRLKLINELTRPEQELQAMITEFNINWQNPAGDDVSGLGANSFFGGQWIANAQAIAADKHIKSIMFWSVAEGGDGVPTDLGYISHTTLTKKPSYYHFQMMAQNHTGKILDSSSNQGLVRAAASREKAGQVNVFVYNFDQSTSYSGEINLNNQINNYQLEISVNAKINSSFSLDIPPDSTRLYKFSRKGLLLESCDYNLSEHASAGLAPVCG